MFCLTASLKMIASLSLSGTMVSKYYLMTLYIHCSAAVLHSAIYRMHNMRTALYCIIEGGREWEITYGVPAVLNQVHVAQSNLVLELHHLNCAIYVTHKPHTLCIYVHCT